VTFSTFMPAITRDYTASTTATVTSTAADAVLTVADPSSTATGHLVNGSFSLPQALVAKVGAAAFAPIGGSASPTALLRYPAPVGKDSATVDFKQSIGETDGLRSGTYGKTLVFTTSTSTP
jgi:hypothetical protein